MSLKGEFPSTDAKGNTTRLPKRYLVGSSLGSRAAALRNSSPAVLPFGVLREGATRHHPQHMPTPPSRLPHSSCSPCSALHPVLKHCIACSPTPVVRVVKHLASPEGWPCSATLAASLTLHSHPLPLPHHPALQSHSQDSCPSPSTRGDHLWAWSRCCSHSPPSPPSPQPPSHIGGFSVRPSHLFGCQGLRWLPAPQEQPVDPT
jgi:hypothetical protein